MKRNKTMQKGFTLIELLVVIAIIAILSVVVILTLNPAELLRQSRDSNRISDLSVTKSAIAFYLASVNTPSIESSTAGFGKCHWSAPTGTWTATSSCSWFPTLGANTTSSLNPGIRTVDGTGWIPVNFNGITAGGSPLAQLPADPLNIGANYYTYTASNTTLLFKLATFMESTKYNTSGTSDVASTDGGQSNYAYEQGTNLSL
jgi:prepilin-type N-terminal cleavage/methylation domain-containing protein